MRLKLYKLLFSTVKKIQYFKKRVFLKFFVDKLFYIRNNTTTRKVKRRRLLPKIVHKMPKVKEFLLKRNYYSVFYRPRAKNFKKRKSRRIKNLFFPTFLRPGVLRGMRKKAILYFHPRYSNYYITLLDMHYKPIAIYSAGRILEPDINKKKTKLSTIYCTAIFSRMLRILKKFNVRILYFEIKDSFDKHFKTAYKFFISKGIKIPIIKIDRRIPHHLGLKKRKLRRI